MPILTRMDLPIVVDSHDGMLYGNKRIKITEPKKQGEFPAHYIVKRSRDNTCLMIPFRGFYLS